MKKPTKARRHRGTEAQITCILETSAPDVFYLTSGKIDEKLYFMGSEGAREIEESMKTRARGIFHGSREE